MKKRTFIQKFHKIYNPHRAFSEIKAEFNNNNDT